MRDFAEIWVYLSSQPLIWLTATVIAYAIGDALFRASGRLPLVNPVLIAVTLLAGLLWGTGTSYRSYFEGAQFVHFLLGPATVCLAFPLWENLPKVRRSALACLAALFVGSGVAVGSALGIAYLMGVEGEPMIALITKSVTAPVAIGIAQSLGGSATQAAVIVIATGICGAMIATPLLNLLGLKDWRARGFAVGVAAHGIGTARALQVHPKAGAFAGLGMGLNALLTAIAVPLLAWFFR